MTRVWLVGERGMLGQAVARQLTCAKLAWVGSDAEVDITDLTAVQAFAADVRATHVLNCAAYTAVDGCETEAAKAHAVNGQGPANVAATAARLGSVAVHVSTDYVFDGTSTIPYAEGAPCQPLGVYGASKRAGEQAFLAALEKAAAPGIVVRTSWLFGRGGKNFVSTMLELFARRAEVAVVADQFGRPTYCDDLAGAMLALAGLTCSRSAAAGIYHFANTGALSWHGFAQAILSAARARGRQLACQTVRPIGSADYPTPARRPAYSVLDTAKVTATLSRAPRAWQRALDDYMDTLTA